MIFIKIMDFFNLYLTWKQACTSAIILLWSTLSHNDFFPQDAWIITKIDQKGKLECQAISLQYKHFLFS